MSENSRHLIQVLIPPLEQPFTYEVPALIAKTIEIGFRVNVPFGRRHTSGFVIGHSTQQESENKSFQIKSIQGSTWSYPHFIPSQLKLFRWMAEYYGTSLSQIIELAIPPSVTQKFDQTIHLDHSKDLSAIRGALQKKLLEKLKASNDPLLVSELCKQERGARSALRALEKSGFLELRDYEIIDQHLRNVAAPAWAKDTLELNQEQSGACQHIISAVEKKSFCPYLLHGVTGSGKTEVYIEAIRAVLKNGQGALVIVPEIALTPQLIDRFRARLGSNIALLHSALPQRVRWDSWRALIEGRSSVAIGARSAIFAPVNDLGLIIVDEEHDSSYKQSEGIRYNARDVAIVRAKQEHCPVVLGSATPSLETFYHASQKKYHYISLNARPYKTPAIEIELVDLNQYKPWEMPTRNVSPKLLEALRQNIADEGQAFVLYNRRGFASYLQCERCEAVLECPNCSVTMTYHQQDHSLVCHYCNLRIVPPNFCQKCCAAASAQDQSTPELKPQTTVKPGKLVQRGAGTEKIFEELQTLLPEAKIARLDRDAVSDMDHYRSILDQVRKGETQILVGTQMIAKGHDLPGVTLVGIADCDVGLHMPDFRSGERIFQLLTQAAGRAGRGEKPGRVILQTRVPRHASLLHTLNKDYTGFATQELESRKRLSYPPFTRILRIVASSSERDLGRLGLEKLAALARSRITQGNLPLTVLGPSPCPLQKLKTEWRFHLLIKGISPVHVHSIMRELQATIGKLPKIKLTYDMDPQEML